MAYCFTIAYLLGRPGSDLVIDHAMEFLWNGHRDSSNGGYFWGVGYDGPADLTKKAYGHAFVLLAAASAKLIGHPDADRLLDDISTILSEHFWEEQVGAAAEEFAPDWQPLSNYRGQNANMHLTEALMAAFEATSDRNYLQMAERIAELIIRQHAPEHNWHVPEHFTADWQLDRSFFGDPVFRPSGTTPGHSLEWSRLLLQLWELGGRRLDWLPDASQNLFASAVRDGWDTQKGGFYYTLEWDETPSVRDRYSWPCCEGIGAAYFLGVTVKDDLAYEGWYRKIWNFTAARFIDKFNGGWYPQLGADQQPNVGPFYGKVDLYHALQACIIPLLPTTGSITRGLITTGVKL
jgi:mannose/cellobiose epimerase-like protein (N-acyl-D-glucosamine 2-epimerase family)